MLLQRIAKKTRPLKSVVMHHGNKHMPNSRTLIQSYASAQIGGLIGKIHASSKLGHRLTKGELRELFLSDLLRPFLTHQFGLGSGIIVNRGEKKADRLISSFMIKALSPHS